MTYWSIKWVENHGSQVQIPVETKVLGDFFPSVLTVVDIVSYLVPVAGESGSPASILWN